MSPEGRTAGVRREARRQWKITEMPPVNAQSLGLIELGFLRVDSTNRNQILSKIRSRSRPDRCIWHANRDKSNQLSNHSMSCQSINHILAQFPRMSTHQSIKSMSSTHVTLSTNQGHYSTLFTHLTHSNLT